VEVGDQKRSAESADIDGDVFVGSMINRYARKRRSNSKSFKREEVKEMKSKQADDTSPSQQIDAIIAESSDWRGKRLSQLRTLIKKADPVVVEEVKWKKPSNPRGVPVWSHGGILCIGDTLKNAVRLTFPNGAQMTDPKKLFNTRLESNTVRAIDFHESDTIDEAALEALILEAMAVNIQKSHRATPSSTAQAV
jgi:hypothetical protein